MLDIILDGIVVLVIIDVVSVIMNKVKTNQAKHQKSLDDFEVRLDSIFSIICVRRKNVLKKFFLRQIIIKY